MNEYKGVWTQDVRRAFSALAYAHLGELLSEPAKRKALYDENLDRSQWMTPSITGVSSMLGNRQKHIALVVDGEIRSSALRYALNACMRLGVDLEVLTNLPTTEIEAAIAYEDIEPGLTYQVFQLGTDLLSGIAQHVRHHINTLFLVTSATDTVADKFVMQCQQGLGTHVPWFVVSDEMCVA